MGRFGEVVAAASLSTVLLLGGSGEAPAKVQTMEVSPVLETEQPEQEGWVPTLVVGALLGLGVVAAELSSRKDERELIEKLQSLDVSSQ